MLGLTTSFCNVQIVCGHSSIESMLEMNRVLKKLECVAERDTKCDVKCFVERNVPNRRR